MSDHNLETRAGRALALADRPEGISTTEFAASERCSASEASRTLLDLLRSDRVTRAKASHKAVRYFVKPTHAAEFLRDYGTVAPPVKFASAKPGRAPAGEGVITAKTKHTVAPAFEDMRFKPEPGFVGEFSREWARLRGASMKASKCDALLKLLSRQWVTPLVALQEVGVLSLAQRVSVWRAAGMVFEQKTVRTPSGSRVAAYRLMRRAGR